MKTQTGIWLDSDQARFVTLKDGEVSTQTVESEVEHHNPVGGYGGSQKHLAQDAISERKLLERRLQQMNRFYDEIISKLSESDEIYIMGPAEAKIGLQKKILQHPEMKDRLHKVEAADHLTHNQLVAKVKAFFAN